MQSLEAGCRRSPIVGNTGLESLVCGYSREARNRKLLAMVNVRPRQRFVAYIDESHGSRNRKFLLLAACVTEYQRWVTFSDEWQAVLDASPRIGAFHMREARNRSGNFQGWEQIDVDLKVIALTEVIVRLNPYIVTCFVDEGHHGASVGPIIRDVRNPYSTCFMAMTVSIARMQLHHGLTIPVDYVFDEKGDTEQEALLWYATTKEAQPPEIQKLMGSTPVFRDDEEVLPLQAADLIAWRYRRLLEGDKNDPELASSMRLDNLTHGEFAIPNSYLDEWASKMLEVNGVRETKHLPSIYEMIKSSKRKLERRNRANKGNADKGTA